VRPGLPASNDKPILSKRSIALSITAFGVLITAAIASSSRFSSVEARMIGLGLLGVPLVRPPVLKFGAMLDYGYD
jgi:hypothetical protein